MRQFAAPPLVRPRPRRYPCAMVGTLRGWIILAPVFFALAALAPAGGCAGADLRLETFEQDGLSIRTADGKAHRFQVELARSPAQQAQGLMYRRTLAEDAGMLFLYDPERPAVMWMKNTLIPLDMLFIARDGRIVMIVERTVPRSLETIVSDQTVSAVLEVRGGTVARLGIGLGDRVVHPAFGGGS